MSRLRNDLERFLDLVHIDDESGCWLFVGAVTESTGYGKFNMGDNVAVNAHRYAYLAFVGDIVEGNYVLHTCDTRCCVNPDHLIQGTQKENMRQASERKRLKVPSLTGEKNPSAKLSGEDVKNILWLKSLGLASSEIAKCFPVSRRQVRDIGRGSWRCIN